MRKLKSIFLFVIMAFMCQAVCAKKYKFDINHSCQVEIVRVAQEGTKYLKAWGVAGNADKAMDQAMQDAVTACLFTGVEGNQIAGKIPPLTSGRDAYEAHKEFFDQFFTKGEFLNYVKNVNSGYPTGENNIATKGGRKVGIYVVVMYDNLRQLLEKEGIVKSLNSYF